MSDEQQEEVVMNNSFKHGKNENDFEPTKKWDTQTRINENAKQHPDHKITTKELK